jgi:hypothetical protein
LQKLLGQEISPNRLISLELLFCSCHFIFHKDKVFQKMYTAFNMIIMDSKGVA